VYGRAQLAALPPPRSREAEPGLADEVEQELQVRGLGAEADDAAAAVRPYAARDDAAVELQLRQAGGPFQERSRMASVA
jgi:hypothetical protein